MAIDNAAKRRIRTRWLALAAEEKLTARWVCNINPLNHTVTGLRRQQLRPRESQVSERVTERPEGSRQWYLWTPRNGSEKRIIHVEEMADKVISLWINREPGMTVVKFSRFLTREFEGVRSEDTRAIIRWYKEEEKNATAAPPPPPRPPPPVPPRAAANSRARPTQPARPAAPPPTHPARPNQPARPTQATQATRPTQPAWAIRPARPAAPPTQPVPPTQPSRPTQATRPHRSASQRFSPYPSASVTLNNISRATNATAVQPTTSTAGAANAPVRPTTQRHFAASVTTANYGNSRDGFSARRSTANDGGSSRNARTSTSSNFSGVNGQSHRPEPTTISRRDEILNNAGAFPPPQMQSRPGISARSSTDGNVSRSENSDSQAGISISSTAPTIPTQRHNHAQLTTTSAQQNHNFGTRIQASSTNEPTRWRHERPGDSARRVADSRPKTPSPPRPAAARAQQARDSSSRLQNSEPRPRMEGSLSNLPAATRSRSQVRSSEQQEAAVLPTPQNSNFGHRDTGPSSSISEAAHSVRSARESSIPDKVNTGLQHHVSHRPAVASQPGLLTAREAVHASDTAHHSEKAPRVEHDIVNVYVKQEPQPLAQLQDELVSGGLIPQYNHQLTPMVLHGLADPTSGDLPAEATNHSQSLGNGHGLGLGLGLGLVLPEIIQSYVVDTSNNTPPRKAMEENAEFDGTQLVENGETGVLTIRRSQSPPLHQPELLSRVPRTPLGRYTPRTAAEPFSGDNLLDARGQHRQETILPSHNPRSSGNNPSARTPTSRNEPSERLERPVPPTGPRYGNQGSSSNRGGHRGSRGHRGGYRGRQYDSYTPAGREYRDYRGGRGRQDNRSHSGNFYNRDHHYAPGN